MKVKVLIPLPVLAIPTAAVKDQVSVLHNSTVNPPVPACQISSSITLADGTMWFIVPRDSQAELITTRLIRIMGLQTHHSLDWQKHFDPSSYTSSISLANRNAAWSHVPRSINILGLSVGRNDAVQGSLSRNNGLLSISPGGESENLSRGARADIEWFAQSDARCKSIECRLEPIKSAEHLFLQLQHISLVISQEAEWTGGLLIHGALVEWCGQGVVLAGPGNVGKSTASSRLPSPWRSLSDDMTLIVKDDYNNYWAHPWPTWSRFYFGEGDGSWNTQQAIPLKGIFFLQRGRKDNLDLLRPMEAVCRLKESAEQASRVSILNQDPTTLRQHRLSRFDSSCDIASQIPTYRLSLTKTGSFWIQIQELLENCCPTSEMIR